MSFPDLPVYAVTSNRNEYDRICHMFDGVSDEGTRPVFHHITKDCKSDYEIMREVIELTCSQDGYILICQQDAVCYAEPRVVLNLLSQVTDDRSFDLLYLHKYMDRGDLFTQVRTYNNIQVVQTSHPHGCLCMLISPLFRDVFTRFDPNVPLNQSIHWWIKRGEIIALTAHPNIVSYNILNRTHDDLLTLTCECVNVDAPIPRDTTVSTDFVCFLVIIIFAIVLMFVVVIIFRSYQRFWYTSLYHP